MGLPSVVHRDEVAAELVDAGDMRFVSRQLAAAAGARLVGCSHYEVPARAQQMPVHVHGDEEESFFVLAGSGLSWQDGHACLVSCGDTVVHRADGRAHTFLSGDSGLELLAFASGSETHLTWLPRARVMWAGPHWVPPDAPHPFELEAAAGPLERPAPGEPPGNVVALAAVKPEPFSGAEVRALGAAAGAIKAGLNYVRLSAGQTGAPPHCHALEEELFVVLDGGGTLFLDEQQHPLRVGDVVARRPATGVPHAFGAGPEGMTYLAYGTSVPGDSVYYPRTGKVWLSGLGVMLDTR